MGSKIICGDCLIELNPEYMEIAERRIWNVAPLFAGVENNS